MHDSPEPTNLWLQRQMAAARPDVVPVAVRTLAATFAAILQAFCIGALLAGAVAGNASPWLPAAGFVGLAVLRAWLGHQAELAAFEAGAAARTRLLDTALARMLAAGPALLRRHHSAVLANILVDRIEQLDGLFARWMPAVALAIGGPLLVVAAMALLDPIGALILLGCGLLVPLGMALSGLGAAAATKRQFAAMQHLQTRFLDRLRGIATIVLAGQTAREADALAQASNQLRVHTMRVLRVAFLSSAVLDFALAVALVALAMRYVSIGTPSGFALTGLFLAIEFFAPLRGFAAVYQDRLHANEAAAALASLPNMPPPAPDLPVRHVAARGLTIAFEDVDFTWDARRGKALDGLSFRLPAGETLVLAGPSGAGKSTVFEILLGFVRPDRGVVRINGADLDTLVPAARAKLIAWIGQRPMLFAGSIEDNIRFADPDATAVAVADAVRAAKLDTVLATLPDGLATRIGEGGYGLSGGQAQRIAVARAFLRNAPLLLLDEPTAHLDPATEAELLDSLRRLMAGRTVIVATHSLAAQGLVQSFDGRRLDLHAPKVAA